MKILNSSDSAFESGQIVGQTVLFSGTKNIHKVSLGLTISNTKYTSYIIEKDGIVSFQAANWQRSRYEWAMQPTIGDWETSGITIHNLLQPESFTIDDINYVPHLGYDIFFSQSGTFELWGYGYTSPNSAVWSFDGSTNLRSLDLGEQISGMTNMPLWTKIADIYVPQGGLYQFDVYLLDTSVVLDQFYFTNDSVLSGISGGLTTPFPISESPFNTGLRLRTLNSGELDSLTSPVSGSTSITSWLNSQDMAASGVFNYEIRDNSSTSGVEFTDGLSMEFFQVGGNENFFAAWNYSNVENSLGNKFSSSDFGQNYVF